MLAGADNGEDLILYPENKQAELLEDDPINDKYKNNTLVWHYDNGIDRYFRLIEAQAQEYFVINKPLGYDLIIDPHAKQTEGFIWYKKARAYDNVGTSIKVTEDEDKIVTLRADSVRDFAIDEEKLLADKLECENEIRMAQRIARMEGNEPEVVYPVVIDPHYNFSVTVNDGTMCNWGSTSYSTTRNATTANYMDDDTITAELGQIGLSLYGYYEIDRCTMYFDTSALGADVTITAAELRIYSNWESFDNDFDVQIQNG
jgi:hypothetical protein